MPQVLMRITQHPLTSYYMGIKITDNYVSIASLIAIIYLASFKSGIKVKCKLYVDNTGNISPFESHPMKTVQNIKGT